MTPAVRPLTGSWSKGRNGHYAYYHCQRQCRAVNVSKAELEGAFADELALLQPTAGYMRLVKDRILHVWEQRRAEARDRKTDQERGVKTIQQKLDRLDEAFVFAQTIDGKSYERQRDRLREDLTLAQIDHTPKQLTNSTYRARPPPFLRAVVRACARRARPGATLSPSGAISASMNDRQLPAIRSSIACGAARASRTKCLRLLGRATR